MKPTIPITLILTSLLAISIACGELDDDYSYTPGLGLNFSTDTLHFDTIFSGIPSATRGFMVYNHNSSALMIATIRLSDQGNEAFRINVDGRRGQSFQNIRIGAKDSIYVMVEVTTPEANSDAPLIIQNKLEFEVNGSLQHVLLAAWSQDVHLIKGGFFIKNDTSFSSQRPFLIYDSLVIDSGIKLKIEAGATLYMHNKATIIVDGTLIIEGTQDKQVEIRGDRFDGPTSQIAYDQISGQWGGICFGTNSFNNELTHASIRNGYNGLICLPSTPERNKLRIANSQIINMRQAVLETVNCKIEALNTEFANSEGNIVAITGGEARFVHCTMANYYIFSPGRRPDASVLLLANHAITGGQETDYPLTASFDNCIIDGNNAAGRSPWTGEIALEQKESLDFNIRFNHCAMKTLPIENSSLAAVQFLDEQSPLYRQLGNSENSYIFDFRPAPSLDKEGKAIAQQPIIGQADTAVARLYPTDRHGITRIDSLGKADIGAYAFVPLPEPEK
ncbi:MAG: hypothetical protein LBD28_03750 [Tannerellaceae bacterium]|jgi:hypothetical protein|nr:hypothetical protein [Tannerellaceae bacterium]